jgi:hypothetical protein
LALIEAARFSPLFLCLSGLPSPRPHGALAAPAREVAAAAEYARAEATRRADRTDFEIFRAWCAERRVSVLHASPESVAAFLAHEAERGTNENPAMGYHGGVFLDRAETHKHTNRSLVSRILPRAFFTVRTLILTMLSAV